jgi:hypothetical protein
MPDCRNCAHPMRMLCDALSEEIGEEYRRLASAPPEDRARLLAEVEISDGTQAALMKSCAERQRQERPAPQKTRPPGPDRRPVSSPDHADPSDDVIPPRLAMH